MGIDDLIVSLWMYPALAMIFILAVIVCYAIISFFRRSKKSDEIE